MADEAGIIALFKAYETAFRDKDAAGCGACYSQDAEYIACGMAAIRGRTAIASLHDEIIRSGSTLESIVTDETLVSGDLAYVRQTLKVDGTASIAMLVLRRTDDGSWLVRAETEVPVV